MQRILNSKQMRSPLDFFRNQLNFMKCSAVNDLQYTNLSPKLLVYNQNHQCFGNFELSLSVYKTTAPANFMTGILAENLTVDMSACGYFSRITDEEIDVSITSYSDNYVSYIGGWWQLCQ